MNTYKDLPPLRERPTAKPEDDNVKPPPVHQSVNDFMSRDVLSLILVFRFTNALLVNTFFQPDEYFQALEPAWQLAFGPESGAWITWEWQNQLRSSLHPVLFAVVYYVSNSALEYLSIFPQARAMIMTVMPRILQSLIAAAGDYFTWQLAEKIYGRGSDIAWTTFLLTLFSPWQWFCSTRTFSNSLEMTLTIVALYYWPWRMAGGDEKPESDAKKSQAGVFDSLASVNNLRLSLLAAALACILRPTNLLIWFSVAPLTILRPFLQGHSLTQPKDYMIIFREVLLCGSAMLLISALSDRFYYGEWTFPAYQWFRFNVGQDLAVFYGSMPFHYYISQGIPLLLTTYLPFLLAVPFVKTTEKPTGATQNLTFIFSATIISSISVLSLIQHKEVRFIYPLLPLLHILLSPTVTAIFMTTETCTKFPEPFPSTPIVTVRKTSRYSYLKYSILLLNIAIGYYTTQIHQAGVISVVDFLRKDYETLALDSRGNLQSMNITYPDMPALEEWERSDFTDGETFAAFLMPCHSTPWRSHLAHPGLNAWALTCEPPLALPAGSKERSEYRDEADRFFDNPSKFLTEEVGGRDKPWPRYVVGFEGIGADLKEWYENAVPGFKVKERWRTSNSHWHDDPRRVGDVVVWEFVDGSIIQRMW
ncbi:hypothetical protein BP5796_09078 [Coleophoma crateriformis]|uniref:Mannosyltransferase n=1 Tax=Coleophoma crateriformis TaxID=565419 RepID=A0A3D8R3D6_9HELO|nr:hypothetical protein BP5796_09078 [Coleophoma crateriformis]